MTASAHVDTFARDNLPPGDAWPDLIFELPELQYPARMNCATELLDRALERGFGDRIAIVSPEGVRWTYAELLAQAKATAGAVAQTEAAAAAAPQPAGAAPAGPTGTVMTPAPQIPAKDRVGTLTVIDGKTDEKQYTLTGKLTVIGKSDMATIKLKGWFAPNVAAIITRRDAGYQIASQDKGAKVKVSGADVPSGGHHDLAEGDTVEVSGVKMTFTLEG